MAIAPWVDQFLAQRFAQLGMKTLPRIRRQSQTQVPPATRNMPDLTKETFFEEEQRKAIEPEGGFMDKLLAPVLWAANALSAGEYGVAGAIKALMKDENPVTAFWEGIKSGFSNEREYQVRMYDILTELGWDPESTPASVSKHVLGFALGMIADPLTYATFGAASAATRFSKKTIETIAKSAAKAGGKVPQLLTRGMYGNKLYQKLEKAILDEGAGVIKTANLDEVGKIRALMGAQKSARNQALKTVLPLSEDIGKDLSLKNMKHLKKAANMLYGNSSREAIERLSKEGWQKFFDPGGLKFQIPFTGVHATLLAPKVMGPRSASLMGGLVGPMLKENKGMIHTMASSIAGTKIWKDLITEPMGKIGAALEKSFVRTAGMTQEGKRVIFEMEATEGLSADFIDRLKAWVGSVDDVAMRKETIGKSTVEIPEKFARMISPGKRQLVSRLLITQEGKRAWIDGNFDAWAKKFMKTDEVMPRWSKELGIKNLTAKDMDDVVVVANKWKKITGMLEQFDTANDIGHKILPDYFPHLMREKVKGGDDLIKSGAHDLGGYSFLDGTRNMKAATWDAWQEMPLGAGQGQVLGKPTDDLMQIVGARLTASFKRAMMQDVLEKAGDLARHPIARGTREFDEMLQLMLKDPKFVKDNAQALFTMAESAEGSWRGLAKADSAALLNSFKKLEQSTTIEQAEKALAKLTVPKNLTGENIKAITGHFKGSVEAMRKMGVGEDVLKVVNNYKGKYGDMLKVNQVERTFMRELNALGITQPDLDKDYIPTAKMAPVWKGYKEVSSGLGELKKGYFSNFPKTIKTAQKTRRQATTLNRNLQKEVAALEALPTKKMTLPQWAARQRKVATAQKDIERVNEVLQGLPTASEAKAALNKKYLMQTQNWIQKIKKELGKVTTQVETRKHGVQTVSGVGRLPAMLGKLSAGADAAVIDPKRLQQLYKKLTTGTTEEVSEKIAHFLQPVDDYTMSKNLNKLKVRHHLTGEVVSASEYAFPAAVVRELQTFADPAKLSEGILGASVHTFDKLSSQLKRFLTGTIVPGVLRPAFFVRNKIDLLFRRGVGISGSLLSPDGFKRSRAAWEILKGGDGKIALNGIDFSYRDVREFLQQSGYWHFNWGRMGKNYSKRMDDVFAKAGSGKYLSYRKFREDVSNFMPDWAKKWGPETVGMRMENHAIIEAFMAEMNVGVPVADALDNLGKYLFNYHNLTQTEQVLSRFVLFYNFNRSDSINEIWSIGTNICIIPSFTIKCKLYFFVFC